MTENLKHEAMHTCTDLRGQTPAQAQDRCPRCRQLAGEPPKTTHAQLADAMLRAFAATAEAAYQRGAYGAGSTVYADGERVAANAKAADNLQAEAWRLFYELGADL
jgi:hypothetical protein